MRALIVSLGLWGAVGCVQHVSIGSVPPRSAPFAQRAAAWQRLRPVGMGYQDVVNVRGGAVVSGGAFVEREFNRIVLGDGVEVRAPEDLLPALEADSPAAAAAARAGSFRDARNALELGGGLLLIGSVIGLPIAATVDDSSLSSRLTVAMLVSAAVGGVGVLIGALFIRPEAAEAQREAFSAYRVGLDRRLGVCVGPGGLTECAPSR